MPIPAFTEDGLLPVGQHECTFNEFRISMGFNLTRTGFALRFRQFLHMLPDLSVVTYILVDGSFVQNVTDPSDLDAVLVVESISDGSPGQLLLSWVNKRHIDTKARLGCDVYVADPPLVADYWTRRFGSGRDGRPKGMLRVVRGGGQPDDY